MATRFWKNIVERTGNARRDQFDLLPLPRKSVVFLGDSITESGIWEGWFPNLPIANRGIAGNTVEQVTRRLDRAISDPLAVSLLVGTNDLGGLGSTTNPEYIADSFDQLVRRIRQLAPIAPLFINGVMPRRPKFAAAILDLNSRYRKIADTHDATFLDLWPTLADARDGLRAEYTEDSVHLNGAGYRAWVDVLRPHLAPFSPDSRKAQTE